MELVTVAGADAIAWIREHGRFRRTITAEKFRRLFKLPSRHCTWCFRPVGGRRQTWCSTQCCNEFYLRTVSTVQRFHVEQRDGGICAACGVDTNRIQRALTAIRYGYSNRRELTADQLRRRDRLYEFWRQWAKSEGFASNCWDSFWQADHILPVCEGGGMCGLDGLRTLCTRCHKAETKKLAARRAVARRASNAT